MFFRHPEHLRNFSYRGRRCYSLTFCTDGRRSTFTRSETAELATEQMLRAAATERFALLTYCFMPDHLHLLTQGQAGDADLKRFVMRAKQFSGYHHAKRFHERLWQRYGYERVLRQGEPTEDVARYILENPVRAGLVERVGDCPFIGSTLYTREQLIAFASLGSTSKSG